MVRSAIAAAEAARPVPQQKFETMRVRGFVRSRRMTRGRRPSHAANRNPRPAQPQHLIQQRVAGRFTSTSWITAAVFSACEATSVSGMTYNARVVPAPHPAVCPAA